MFLVKISPDTMKFSGPAVGLVTVYELMLCSSASILMEVGQPMVELKGSLKEVSILLANKGCSDDQTLVDQIQGGMFSGVGQWNMEADHITTQCSL